MVKKTIIVFSTICLSVIILAASVSHTASVKYSFNQPPSPVPSTGEKVAISYSLPYPGKISPTSPLWFLKAFRDKALLATAVDPVSRANLLLLMADKRLSFANDYFNKGQIEVSLSVLNKAEMYLSASYESAIKARESGEHVDALLQRLSASSLKHRQLIEQMAANTSDDARAFFAQKMDISKEVFEKTSVSLHELGHEIPPNPFDII